MTETPSLKVVPMPPSDTDAYVDAMIAYLVAQREARNIAHLAYAIVERDGTMAYGFTKSAPAAALLGATTKLTHAICERLDDCAEPQEI